jgi:hypothetical protein
MRASVIQPPAHNPNRAMASSPNSEQVGKCRHRGPMSPEMPYRYIAMSPRAAKRGARAKIDGEVPEFRCKFRRIDRWRKFNVTFLH